MACNVILNAYPDSIGGTLQDIADILNREEFKGVFSTFYILPSLFVSDLDRGFSIISYDLNPELATKEALNMIKDTGMTLKLDFVLNHLSIQSKQFQDILKNGQLSKYKDFFINWNTFWAGHGSMTKDGYIQPNTDLIKDMFFRKPGLPILMVPMPDGTKIPYWNTFYQEVVDEGRQYLGQMDLNINSPLVWEYYDEVLHTLADYGAKIIRLDAFAYAPKEVGAKNFLNEPGTWELLEKVQEMADKYRLQLLPEIHASYDEKTYRTLSEKGYMTYDFFLPGLIIDALENKSGNMLVSWAVELWQNQIQTVNMLGCHDGIPLLDLKGMLPDERIQQLIDVVVKRGGYVKNLHGKKNIYYQVNATYYSALGEDEKKMLLARAIQMFMPGTPQVWYLDLFAGKNDYEAVRRSGEGGHKEINRTNLSIAEITKRIKLPIVQKQIELLRMRNNCKAFADGADFKVKCEKSKIWFLWTNGKESAKLEADLKTLEYKISF
ncbi:Sucrose phosphorylase [Clostridium sp. C105KSO13]|nr:Sucrose phosphorylase [Clostridium sp. C105KSO13]